MKIDNYRSVAWCASYLSVLPYRVVVDVKYTFVLVQLISHAAVCGEILLAIISFHYLKIARHPMFHNRPKKFRQHMPSTDLV